MESHDRVEWMEFLQSARLGLGLHFHFSLSCTVEGNGNTSVFLPGESQGQQNLVGCCLWGRTESDTTEATQQQQQQTWFGV